MQEPEDDEVAPETAPPPKPDDPPPVPVDPPPEQQLPPEDTAAADPTVKAAYLYMGIRPVLNVAELSVMSAFSPTRYAVVDDWNVGILSASELQGSMRGPAASTTVSARRRSMNGPMSDVTRYPPAPSLPVI